MTDPALLCRSAGRAVRGFSSGPHPYCKRPHRKGDARLQPGLIGCEVRLGQSRGTWMAARTTRSVPITVPTGFRARLRPLRGPVAQSDALYRATCADMRWGRTFGP